jgi:HPt (histidine-containing phosphotransfer) domain-containing protein
MNTGLRSVRGRLPRLVEFLVRFGVDHVDDAQKIRVRLSAGELTDARRVAHSLKGVAGTLGLKPIFQRAATVESAILPGSGRLEASSQLDQLNAELARLAPLLLDLMPRRQAAESFAAVDWERLTSEFERVGRLLATDDMAVTDAMLSLAPRLDAALEGPLRVLARQLAEQIDDFAFEQAQQSFDALLAGEERLRTRSLP